MLQNNGNYGTHKDDAPIRSITRIRNILGSMGISPVESYWDSFGEANYSLMLSDPDLGAVNGKGISREYALASALGEFMERLQNLWLYPLEFGLMKEPKLTLPDLQMLDLVEGAPFLGEFAHIFGISPGSKQPTGLTIPFLPYWDVSGEKVSFIPLNLLTSSNGMCAGNTPEEALVEGICEVIERYLLSRLFFESAAVPTIPMEYVEQFRVNRLITDIRKKGFNVIVKDLTRGGRYPVLAVLMLNDQCTKYSVRLGSSPHFETALQRCLTEVGQNHSFSDIEYKMMDLQFPFCEELLAQRSSKNKALLLLHYMYNNIASLGHFPADLFSQAPPDPSFKNAFQESFQGNRGALSFLVDLLQRQNRQLYIRDVSFLDFPAYHVYISGLSCVEPVWFSGKMENYQQFAMRSQTRDLLLRLRSLDAAQLRSLADCMKKDIESPLPYAPHVFPATQFTSRLLLKPANENGGSLRIDRIPYAVWLVPILYKLKEYGQALHYLSYVLDRENYEWENFRGYDLKSARQILKKKLARLTPRTDPAAHLYQPMFFFLKNLSLGSPFEKAKDQASEYFGKEKMEQVIAFLDLKSQHLPECGDCRHCPLQEDCCYDTWKERITAIQERIGKKFPDQSRLREVFSGLKG